MVNSHTLAEAEIAMGSTARLMAEYSFQKKMGWLIHFDPDEIVKRAGRQRCVKSLIWC